MSSVSAFPVHGTDRTLSDFLASGIDVSAKQFSRFFPARGRAITAIVVDQMITQLAQRPACGLSRSQTDAAKVKGPHVMASAISNNRQGDGFP
jgi:hypothetical protein